MGDRAYVIVRDERLDDDVYLYSHWLGEGLASVVARALDSKAARTRWDEAPYLARIIFEAMLAFKTDDATGFGIGTRAIDSDHPYVVVDVARQEVYVIADPTQRRDVPGVPFNQFASTEWEL